MKIVNHILCAVLPLFLLDGPAVLCAQNGQQAALAPKLFIEIIEGDNALNNVRQRTSRETIVEVQDENHKPVAGAAVLFTLPSNGPGGVFLNGARTLSVNTDASGRATMQGMKLSKKGKFQIQVNATYQGLTAARVITQTNVVGAAVAGGVAAGIGLGTGIAIGAGAAAVVVAVVLVKVLGGGGKHATVSIGTPRLP